MSLTLCRFTSSKQSLLWFLHFFASSQSASGLLDRRLRPLTRLNVGQRVVRGFGQAWGTKSGDEFAARSRFHSLGLSRIYGCTTL